ncbi:MAG: PKD domain-containing protein [Micropruina sp.]|uniref:PKD domain-containing protein n=1 Tax=Micropruina sp. TaxID=2737536 RepID=UPI0039E50EE8
MSNSILSRLRARLSGLVAGTLIVTAGLAGVVPVQQAEAAVLSTDPATVTAEALPTWQLNGVVWSTVVVGNTAYVTGEFTQARPPATAVTSSLAVDAKNIFAFDVTTGNPVTFSHSLNAQGLVIRANDSGTRLYVGGDFTEVDGVARSHIAAFDLTSTGAPLTTFNARTDGQVRGLVPIGDTVYAGGNFRAANSQARALFAAFDAGTGNLTAWAPAGDTSGYVFTMVAAPDKSRIIAGGSFTTINGVDAYGMGSIDAVTGATLPWAANTKLKAAGNDGAIDTLSTDGTSIFGAGYSYGTGAAFEGTFSADPTTGAINWVNDCLGDTYDTFPMDGALYTVSHDHNCTIAGAFPDTDPRARWQKASAERIGPTIGTIASKDVYNWDYTGIPYTGLLHWYPDLEFGTYTSSKQAAWAIGGNGDYLVMGGEFPSVNGSAQQSLVRFAKKPISSGLKPTASTGSTPTPVPAGTGTVRVVFGAMFDRDDAYTEYDIYRGVGSTTKKVGTISASDAEFWSLPTYTFTDTGLTDGTQVRYQTRARDAAGNSQWSAWSGYVTVSSATSAYAGLVAGQGATHLWQLGEATGSTLTVDAIGSAHGAPNSTATLGGAGALTNETGTSLTITSAAGAVTTTTAEQAPTTFSVEAWVKTTSTLGGRIVGFGDQVNTSNVSTLYDRVLYLDTGGRPNLMINDTAVRTVTSTTAINDGNWHHVVGTVDDGGMQLFVDGIRVARDQRYTTPRTYSGFWRIGWDTTTGFTNKPSNSGLVGSIDEVAVYPRALSLTEVQAHVTGSGRTGSWTAQPTDEYAAAVVANTPDLYWRLDESSGSALDSSGSGNVGSVTETLTRGVEGAISGNAAATFNGSSNIVVAQRPWVAPQRFTAEVWFKTTTAKGGKLIGFGTATSGLSSSYDRHVWMLNTGKLAFGTYPGSQQIITSANSYNDGQWHHVAASQGADGMKLYIDAQLVGTNATTTGQVYTGYWRIGGDKNWSGASSSYFAGTLDEAAVYPSALTENDIRAHYAASGRTAPNRAPSAAFSYTKSFQTVNVDASGSTDPDGAVASYAWDFGDGTTATGVTASHTYASAGTYSVTLTVTDAQGLTNSTTQSVVAAQNQAPVAAFAATVDLHEVAFDAAGSTDPDGTVASYAWDFGDGSTGTGATASHTYASAGSFTVSLTVTDDQGATNTVTQTVETVDPPNQLPTAAFSSQLGDLDAQFSAAASSDADGTIAGYAWDFGDGSTATGVTASHTYTTAGSYTVTLTVTDNSGGTATVTHSVTLLGANQLPTAAFSWTASDGKLSFDAGASTDPDGTVESYAWDFGDDESGTGKTPTHTYTASGTYTVELTVTDDRGGEHTVSHDVTVVVNGKPTAAFTSSASFLEVSFDGTGSTDADGTIAGYAWDFGDGSTGTGASPEHSYAAAGSYTVKLTVTDDDGAEDSVTKSITVNAPGPLATDAFGRTVSNGWGTADGGGAWTIKTGSARFSVAGGKGKVTMITAGSGYSAMLDSVSTTNTDLSFDVSVDTAATGAGEYFSAFGRSVQGVGSYSAKVRVQPSGAVQLYLLKTIGSTETVFVSQTVSGLTYTTGETLKMRLQVTGTDSTTLRVKLWSSGNEPTAWNLSTTDSTASLQAAGSVGLNTYVSGTSTSLPIVYSFDNLVVAAP